MTKGKIIFFEAGEAEAASLRGEIALAPELSGYDVSFHEDKLTQHSAAEAADAAIVSVFIDSAVDAASIASLKAANLITTRSTGYDHIDRAAAAARGIRVANVPAYGSHTVAEYAFALILGMSRKTFDAVRRMKDDMDFDVYGLMGIDLYGKTIGIVGTGKIGQNVAAIARGFGMEVIAYDTFMNKEAAAKIGYTYVSLDELLRRSDIVTLHVPFTPETRHLINTQNIYHIKRGALLVNTARGEICDTAALLEGLKDGTLGGVALDVIEGERRLKDDAAHLFTRIDDELMHPDQRKRLADYRELMKHPGVYITPHIAYYTAEAQREISRTTVANIAAFLRGEALNVVS